MWLNPRILIMCTHISTDLEIQPCTVGDKMNKMKFRIPFRRTAVTRLKMGGGGGNGTSFGKKKWPVRLTGVTV